eukprot:8093834-Alexandrium_andersonii.AAC.1
MMGLSCGRAQWLADWCDDTVAKGLVPLSGFLSGLGRLGFASMVLRWEKPLLGPVYAWAAGCSRGALRRVRVPWA